MRDLAKAVCHGRSAHGALESCVFLHSGLDTHQNTRASLVTMLNVPSDLQCTCSSLYRAWSKLAVCPGGTA